MTTPGVPLDAKRALREVFASLVHARRVVVLIGAGVATAARIPDFRSHDGLYNKRTKARDLFSADVFRDPAVTRAHYQFCAALQRQAAKASPTAAHRFIQTLEQKGKLLRVYSQNVDDLELRVGLSAATSAKEGHVVQLHGSVHRVKCSCGYQGELEEDMRKAFEAGEAPPCPACNERGKRTIALNRGCGSLRPAMVLYDEDYPLDQAALIAEMSAHDLRTKVDYVLVMGTSLKIPGFKQLVKDFAKRAHECSGSKPRVVLVNESDVLSNEWNGVFDCHVKGQCDNFCTAALKEWRSCKSDDFMRQLALGDLTNVAVAKAAAPLAKTKRAAVFSVEVPPSLSKKTRNPRDLPTLLPTNLPRRRTNSTTRI